MASISSSTSPNLFGSYVHPRLTHDERVSREQELGKVFDEFLTELAKLPIPQRARRGKLCCLPRCNNSVMNLAAYILCHPWKMFSRAYCCCFTSCGKSRRFTPIPKESLEMLEMTQDQFDRNTCGLFFITPAVISSSYLFPVFYTINALYTAILDIGSSLVLTTAAGTNTYVFSGDIGVVRDGRGDLIVQGGIRVDNISQSKTFYFRLAQHLVAKWNGANAQERTELFKQSHDISDRWDPLLDAIIEIGIQEKAAEDILAPFSRALCFVLDNYQPTIVVEEADTSE